MAFFRLRDGMLDKVTDAPWPSDVTPGWLAGQLVTRDDLLPEKLFVIGAWPVEGAQGLYALDAKGNLVVLLVAASEVAATLVESAAERAWNMRFVDYNELAEIAREYMRSLGVAIDDVAGAHAEHFSREEALAPSAFNRSQRVVALAPSFSRGAVQTIRWRRLEVDISAYAVKLIDVDAGNRLIEISPLAGAQGGALLSLAMAIVEVPSTLVGNARPSLDRVKDDEDAVAGPLRPILGIVERIDKLTHAQAYIALGALVALYFAVFSALALRAHANFGTFGFDLGIFDQGVWLLSKFKDPFITVRGLHLFGDHLSFILLLIAPLYWIKSDPRVLLVVQSAALALGAVPVYLLANERLKSTALSLALAASYLLYPALEWINNDQFHPESLATPLLLFALYFAARSNWRAFAVCAALAVLAKEDVALVMMLLGIYIAVRQNRAVGTATALASLGWFAISIAYILPRFNGSGFFYIQNFSHLGATPGQVIANIVTRPGTVLGIIGQQQKLGYLTQLLSPVAFLPLVDLELFLVALPALFTNLVSQQGYMDSIRYHYTATIVPVLFASSIIALERLNLRKHGRQLAAIALITAAIASNYLLSPSPITRGFDQSWQLNNERKATIERALKQIPANAVVSAHFYMVPHLAHREKIYEFPNPFVTQNWGIRGEHPANKHSIEYIAVDLRNLPPEQRLLVDNLRNNSFRQVFNEDEIAVLKRK